MTYKRDDLTLLRSLTSETPLTYWSPHDFQTTEVESGRLWRIRSDEKQGLPRLGMTTGQVLRLIVGRNLDFIVQEMLSPVNAGACYIHDDFVYWEGVVGSADLLLRDGGRGSRGLVHANTELWSLGDKETAVSILNSLKPAAERLTHSDGPLVLEWILDRRGRFLWVDAKRVPDGFLKGGLDNEPPKEYFSVGVSAESFLALPDTKLAHWPKVVESGTSSITCKSGSPLAHLCTRANLAGLVVRVVESCE